MAPIQVASLFGVLKLDDSNFRAGVSNAKDDMTGLGERFQSMGSSLTSFGQKTTGVGIAVTAMGAPFLAFGAKAVQSFSESEDALAQLDAVLKSTSGSAGETRDELTTLAESLQKTTKFSDEATIGAESMLLTFTNVGKTVFPRATKAILDVSTAMKQDAKSSAIQLGKALNDPIEGISSLTRIGVTFTQGQKDMIKSMVDAGDVAGAQTIILKELEKEFGGSAEAAGKTFGGSLEILNNRFDNVLETLGGALIPVIQQFTGWIGNLIGWFEQLDPGTQQTIAMLIALAGSLAVIGPIIAGIGIAISTVGAIIGGVGALLAGPLLPIALIVGALALLASQSGITLDQVKLALSLIELYASYYLGNFVTAISNVVDGLGDGPKGILAAIAVVAGPIGIGLLLATTGPLGILAAIAAAVLLLGSQPGGFGGALKTAQKAAQDLVQILGILLGKIKEVVEQLAGNVKTGAEGLSNIVSGLTSGKFGLGDVANAINAEKPPTTPLSKTGVFASPQGIAAVQSYLANQGLAPIPDAPAPSLLSMVPGHAGGITSVPYDNYMARLHYGEGVLTEQENRNKGQGVSVQIGAIYANDYAGGQAAARGFKGELEDLMRAQG